MCPEITLEFMAGILGVQLREEESYLTPETIGGFVRRTAPRSTDSRRPIRHRNLNLEPPDQQDCRQRRTSDLPAQNNGMEELHDTVHCWWVLVGYGALANFGCGFATSRDDVGVHGSMNRTELLLQVLRRPPSPQPPPSPPGGPRQRHRTRHRAHACARRRRRARRRGRRCLG